MRKLSELGEYRAVALEMIFAGKHMGDHEGLFLVQVKTHKKPLRVVVSVNQDGWDHVSVSLPNRCPTWDEMDKVKRIFFKPDEVVMQLHVTEEEHISNHSFCLHLWRPVDAAIPLPPSWMVGDKRLGTIW